MRLILLMIFALLCTTCYGEWDVPVVSRRDPCTHEVEKKTVYVMPVCQYPQPLQR